VSGKPRAVSDLKPNITIESTELHREKNHIFGLLNPNPKIQDPKNELFILSLCYLILITFFEILIFPDFNIPKYNPELSLLPELSLPSHEIVVIEELLMFKEKDFNSCPFTL